MPWDLGDRRREYEAIRSSLALFDLTGSDLLAVSGADAVAAVDRLFSKELEYLSPETSILGVFMGESGEIIDVATICWFGNDLLIETSVGGAPRTSAYLTEHLVGDAEVRLLADDLRTVALEGPTLWAATEKLLDSPVTGLPFQGVRPTTFGGAPLLAARTGWTGEFGLKFFMGPEVVPRFVEAASASATPAGRWAMEFAMLEIRQPVLHREVGPDTTIVEAGWNWLVDSEKEEFLGRDAAQRQPEPDRRTVCVRSTAEIVSGTRLLATDAEVGEVTWGERHPVTNDWMGLARVDAAVAASGLTFGVRVDGDQLVGVSTVSSPMVTPTSWGMSNSLLGDD